MSGVAFFAAPAASRARLSSLLVLLVCCASFSASPPTYRGLRPFTQSAFYQPPHKAQHLPVFPSLDLAVPAQLDAALAARAFKKNIILFTFTASAGCAKSCTPLLKSWLGDAVAMVAQLNDVGFTHYIAVTGTPEGCTELHSVWQTHHGARPSCAVAVHPSMGHEEKNQIVRAGWTTRYWLITQCIERGLDVLMHDLDMVFHTDPYALFKSPPLSAAQLIVLPEGAMNGGLCYVQNASSKGAAAWVLRQVERRSVAVSTYEHEHGVNGVGWMNDQDVLQDAMRVAQHAGSSTDWRANYAAWKQGGHNDSEAASHPFWGVLHPQPTQSTPDFMWRTLGGERWDAPAAAAGCPFPPTSEACARWRAWLPLHFANQSIRSTVLHVPADEPERGEGRSELAIAAPTWLWAVGDVTQQGWSHGAHPMTAMTHMLFTELCWSDVFIGSHIGRLLAAGANGYVSTLWALGAEKAKPLLWLHEDAVEALSFASTNHSAAPLKNALRSLGLLAALTGRLPVMPFVPCDAPFIARVREGAPHDVGVSSNVRTPFCPTLIPRALNLPFPLRAYSHALGVSFTPPFVAELPPDAERRSGRARRCLRPCTRPPLLRV